LAIDLSSRRPPPRATGELTEQRVVFQVGQRFAVRQIVDCHNLNIRIAQRSAQYVTSDTAETINTDLTMINSLFVVSGVL
jgi:hypothetical protein